MKFSMLPPGGIDHCRYCRRDFTGSALDHLKGSHGAPDPWWCEAHGEHVLSLRRHRADAHGGPAVFGFKADLPKTSQLSGNARLHWAASKEARDTYRQIVAVQAKNAAARRNLPRFARARLDLLFVLPAGVVDWDNLIAAVKPGIDALKNLRVIADDSVDAIYPFVPDRRRSAGPGDAPGVWFMFTESNER